MYSYKITVYILVHTVHQQYEEALKAVRAGRPCDFGALFDPPGFEPIAQVVARLRASPAASSPAAAMPAGVPSAASIPRASLSPGSSVVSAAAAGGVQPNTKAGAQVNLLLARQLQFKKAALQAKQAGNLAKAKEYLRCAKACTVHLARTRTNVVMRVLVLFSMGCYLLLTVPLTCSAWTR